MACHSFTIFNPHSRKAPELCTHCRAVHSFSKVERYAQNTVRGQRATLLVFFDWAKINRLVITNPVQRKTPAPDPTIRHYPQDVIKQLCVYLAALDAEPVEAMVLYLIIFHAFSVQELRYAEIPIHKMQKGNPLLKLSEAYSVIIPKFAPSLGHCTPGRPGVRLDFPPKAAIWLKPLLERFESWRQQSVRDPSNRYLLVAPSKARHNTPVGNVFVWEIVQRASLRVLGAACNPNTLRKTVGVMFADSAGAGVLRWMGWGEQQAFAYTWAARKTILPLRLNPSQEVELQSSIETIIFPSPREGDP